MRLFCISSFLCLIISLVEVECKNFFFTPLLEKEEFERGRNSSFNHFKEFESHSGFFTPQLPGPKAHVFTWLFKSPSEESPLIVWLVGGDGRHGLWTSFLDEFGYPDPQGDFSLIAAHSFLFIHVPIGAGLSYYEDSPPAKDQNDSGHVGVVVIDTLTQFINFFPEFKDKEIFFGGLGYAAKYAIRVGSIIEDLNDSGHEVNFPFTGLILGNPFLDPAVQLRKWEYFEHLGLLGKSQFDYLVEEGVTVGGFVNEDIQEFSRGWDQLENLLAFYSRTNNFVNFLQPNVPAYSQNINRTLEKYKNVTHASLSYGNYSNDDFKNHFATDVAKGVKLELGSLADKGIKILIMSGQLDLIYPHGLVKESLEGIIIPKESGDDFKRRHDWVDGPGYAKANLGFVNRWKNLLYVFIRGAGHCPAVEKREETLNLIKTFTRENTERALDILAHFDGSRAERDKIRLRSSLNYTTMTRTTNTKLMEGGTDPRENSLKGFFTDFDYKYFEEKEKKFLGPLNGKKNLNDRAIRKLYVLEVRGLPRDSTQMEFQFLFSRFGRLFSQKMRNREIWEVTFLNFDVAMATREFFDGIKYKNHEISILFREEIERKIGNGTKRIKKRIPM